MELLELKVKARDNSGKGFSRRTRVAGEVPAILYGGSGDNLCISINARELKKVLHGQLGEHALLQLFVDGRPELNSPAMIKQVQHHPVRGDVIHADLFRISLDRKIKTVVALHLEGRCRGVADGGVLDHQCRELEIECLALDVPQHIVLDITNLDIGHSIHVADVVAPENVTVLTSGDRAVVAVHAPRVQLETTPEQAAADAAAAAPAEAAAAPAGD